MEAKIHLFQNMVMLHIKGWGQKVKTFFSSESSHVAYQIKGHIAKSTTKAHILSLHTPSAPGVGSKGQNIFFLKVVILHIKFKGMELRHIFCPYIHPPPVWSDQNFYFSERGHVAYQIKGQEV